MAARSRYFFVDKSVGSGDYNSIQTAINAAVAAGASAVNASSGILWMVEVGLGSFTEDIDVPAGVWVKGSGEHWHGTVIVGTATVHSFGALEICRVAPPSGTGWALRAVLDVNGGFPYFGHVNAYSTGSVNGIIKVMEISGSALGCYVRMSNCYLYGQNGYTGDNSGGTAQIIIFHLQSSVVQYVEARRGMVCKTSTTSAGTSQEYLIKNDVTGGGGVLGYVHVVGEWESVYGGGTYAPVPILLDSANTTHPGALLDLGIINFDAGRVIVDIAYAGTNPYHYGAKMGFVELTHGVLTPEAEISYSGEELPLLPALILDHTPTGADVAPDGSVAYVVP